MGLWQAPQVSADMTQEQLLNLVATLIKDIDFLINGNIDSRNVREIAGFLVNLLTLMHKSGLVGMSAEDPQNPDAVRFWAGDADKENAPFRVTQKGAMHAVDAFITGLITGSVIIGAEIKTSENTFPRVEMSSLNNLIGAFQTAGNSIRIVPTSGPGTPAILFDLLGVTKAIMQLADTIVGLTSSGTTDISLQSAKDISLSATAGKLTIDGFAGWSGTFNVVSAVNFAASSTTMTTITVKKGVITNVV